MKVKFNREYLPMLAAFMAVKDVRYYLNGFHVKPHPDSGVILTATDGHRLVTIHDKEGQADGEYILPISKPLLAAAKKSGVEGLPLNSIQFVDNKAYVLYWDCDCEFDFFVNDEESPMSQVSYVEYITPIDGRFPNTARIFKGVNLQPVNHVGVNVEYIGKLTSVCTTRKFPQLNLMFSGSDGHIVAVSGYNREIVSVVMPARVDEVDVSIPDFVKFGGGEPKEEKG